MKTAVQDLLEKSNALEPNKLMGVMFSRMKWNCKRTSFTKEKQLLTNGYVRKRKEMGKFSFQTFEKWCAGKSDFVKIYDEWKKSGYAQELKPSVDRINPQKGYFFNNMQIITVVENQKKGYKESYLVMGHPILQLSVCGEKIKEYPSVVMAAKELEIHDENIHKVARGYRKSAGGFGWIFKENYHSKIKQSNLL